MVYLQKITVFLLCLLLIFVFSINIAAESNYNWQQLITTTNEQLKNDSKENTFIFEAPRVKDKCISHFTALTDRIRAEAKIPDYRNHDLRRTVASNLAKLNYDRTLIGKILNHSGLEGGSKITAIYDRYDYLEEKKNALQEWSDYLDDLVKN